MGTWDKIRAALRREARDARDLLDETSERGHRAMDQRERELNATPEQRLTIEQEKIAANDAEFEALRKQIGD